MEKYIILNFRKRDTNKRISFLVSISFRSYEESQMEMEDC